MNKNQLIAAWGRERIMTEWRPPVACPKCGSTDTRFVEPHYEMSSYECNICGCRFEIEED